MWKLSCREFHLKSPKQVCASVKICFFLGYSAFQVSSNLYVPDTRHQVFSWQWVSLSHLKIIRKNTDYRRYTTPEGSQDHV